VKKPGNNLEHSLSWSVLLYDVLADLLLGLNLGEWSTLRCLEQQFMAKLCVRLAPERSGADGRLFGPETQQ